MTLDKELRASLDKASGEIESDSVDTDSVDIAGGGAVGGVLSQAVEFGKALADDGKLYDTIQTAENNASSWVFVGPGTFSEAVTIDTSDLLLQGSGRATLVDGGTTGNAVNPTATGVVVKDMAAKTASGGGSTADPFAITAAECEVRGVFVEESDRNGIQFSVTGNQSRVVSAWIDSANVDNNDVNIAGDNNVVDDIIGSVTDNGSGNTVGDTA